MRRGKLCRTAFGRAVTPGALGVAARGVRHALRDVPLTIASRSERALERGHGAAAYIAALPAAGLQALARDGLRQPLVAIVDGDPGASDPFLFTIAMASETKVAPANGCERGRLEAWHPALVRYGAGELNERFERHTGRQMSSGAWAAWAAVKIATEAALRADSAAPDVAAALRRLPFDAHKGRALSFDEKQRLVQPLYHVAMCRGTPRVMEVEP